MSALAPTVEAFFTERLMRQRQASTHTVASYRDSLRMLVFFASRRAHRQAHLLDFTHLDAPCIGSFLDHVDNDRNTSARTRNARLTAIRSMFRYAALRHPEHAELIARVLSIPPKRPDRTIVAFLTLKEIEVLFAAPDRSSWTGRRDHALLMVAIQTGLRSRRLTGLACQDITVGTGAHLRCRGKGRLRRIRHLSPYHVGNYVAPPGHGGRVHA